MKYTLSTVQIGYRQIGTHLDRYLLLYPGKIAQVSSHLLALASFWTLSAGNVPDGSMGFDV
jgi:hypothetical protein